LLLYHVVWLPIKIEIEIELNVGYMYGRNLSGTRSEEVDYINP